MHYPLPWFPLSVGSRRCSWRTKPDCSSYRQSLSGSRFWSQWSGFVGGFHLLRWSDCVLVPGVRSCRDWCRYRYICRPCQCVGNDGLIFAVVERPFFAEVVAALEHFAVGVVTVVFVAGHQSVGLTVLNHDVIAVGETA